MKEFLEELKALLEKHPEICICKDALDSDFVIFDKNIGGRTLFLQGQYIDVEALDTCLNKLESSQ